jgi:hypothetical protein
MNLEKINLRQSRDFGETFNTSIKFLRQNFKPFFKSLLFIAGPFLLISSLAGAFYQSSAVKMYSTSMRVDYTSNVLEQFGWAYLFLILTAIIANLVLVGTVYSFIVNYMEKGPGEFTVNDVANTLIKNIGNILTVFFCITLLSILIICIVVGIAIAIGGTIPILGVLLGIGLFFGLLIIFPPLIWQLSVVYLVKMHSDLGPFAAFGKTREVMRDNYWWTWVIVVCSSIGIGIIGLVFALPQGIFQAIMMFSNISGGGTSEGVSIAFLIVATICTFCTTLLYSLLYVINGVHYFSLAEKKDGLGLMDRINEIGNTPDSNVKQQY